MKKVLKSLVLLSLAVVPFLFTSCEEEGDSAKITIAFNQGGKFTTGESITGTITSIEENLTRVVVLLDGNAVKTYSSFNALPILKGNNGVYTIFISDITAAGTYTLRAESKTGESSKTFTIEGTPIDWASGSNTISANGTYSYKQGDTTGELVVSNLTTTSVVVALDGKTAVTLSDDGDSYLLKDGTSSKKAGANANNFLLAKKNGSAQIVDNDGLAAPIQGAEDVIFVAK